LRYCAATDTGRVRTRNEDSYIVSPLDEGLFLAVADGLGGYLAGEVASHLAVRTVAALVAKHQGAPDEAFLRTAFRAANEAIWRARRRPDTPGSEMATTLTAAYVRPGEVLVAHVGDSRLYVRRAAGLERLTEDQSFVGELVRAGALDPADAVRHPQRHMLLHALGHDSEPAVRVTRAPFSAGDVLLLCTDGVTHALSDEELVHLLGEPGPDTAARLVARANELGGEDNATAIVVWHERGEGGGPR
jgi:serine/threonine protein phosphatase PrpC